MGPRVTLTSAHRLLVDLAYGWCRPGSVEVSGGMLSHLAARRWFGVALFHGEAVGVERPPAGAGDPSGTEVEPSADVRSLQAYLRAGREPAIELQVAFGMQLACGDARYVAAGQANGPGVGILQVDRLVDRAAVQQQRARQPGRLQVQHAGDPGTGQLDRPHWSSPGLTSAGEQFGQQIGSHCPCRVPFLRLARMVEMGIAGPQVNQLTDAGSEHKLSFWLCQLGVGEHHDLPQRRARAPRAHSQDALRKPAGYWSMQCCHCEHGQAGAAAAHT
jgi:hypothetical protein